MADPLTIGTALVVVGQLAERLYARITATPPPAAPPRETVVPPAPVPPPSLHECPGCSALARRVDAVEYAADKILLSLARQEGAEEERKQRRADERARRAGARGPSESNG